MSKHITVRGSFTLSETLSRARQFPMETLAPAAESRGVSSSSILRSPRKRPISALVACLLVVGMGVGMHTTGAVYAGLCLGNTGIGLWPLLTYAWISSATASFVLAAVPAIFLCAAVEDRAGHVVAFNATLLFIFTGAVAHFAMPMGPRLLLGSSGLACGYLGVYAGMSVRRPDQQRGSIVSLSVAGLVAVWSALGLRHFAVDSAPHHVHLACLVTGFVVGLLVLRPPVGRWPALQMGGAFLLVAAWTLVVGAGVTMWSQLGFGVVATAFAWRMTRHWSIPLVFGLVTASLTIVRTHSPLGEALELVGLFVAIWLFLALTHPTPVHRNV